MKNHRLIVLLILLNFSPSVLDASTQMRLDQDIEAGKPIVIQLSVALADNTHQWIVPVPESIGNGQNAKSNLYWGARYGVKTYMIRDGGWKKVAVLEPADRRILERLVLKKDFSRNGRVVPVYLLADAWDGRFIRDTIKQFLNYAAGKDVLDVPLKKDILHAGGNAHLIAYIGHNALMDYGGASNLSLFSPKAAARKPQNDVIVLACRSAPFFSSRIEKAGAHPLVLTTGLMAPEAYCLHAAIAQWIAGGDDTQVKKAAAASYNKYQKTGRKAAERLFGVR